MVECGHRRDECVARARVTYLTSLSMTVDNSVDISENELVRKDVGLLETLLKDHSTGRNILWATDDYLPRGAEYAADKTIELPLITGENGIIIQPRVPQQDLNERWDDARLYQKYGITAEESIFIDTLVKNVNW